MKRASQKEYMRKLNASKKEKILKATNNGRCWWLIKQVRYNAHKFPLVFWI